MSINAANVRRRIRETRTPTWDPRRKVPQVRLYGGNMYARKTRHSNHSGGVATIYQTSGKRYIELELGRIQFGKQNRVFCGLANSSWNLIGSMNYRISQGNRDNKVLVNNRDTGIRGAFVRGRRVQIAWDATLGELYVGLHGNWGNFHPNNGVGVIRGVFGGQRALVPAYSLYGTDAACWIRPTKLSFPVPTGYRLWTG